MHTTVKNKIYNTYRSKCDKIPVSLCTKYLKNEDDSVNADEKMADTFNSYNFKFRAIQETAAFLLSS